MRVACIAGARPNFMKIKPVLDALDALGHDTELVHSGQHYDAAMSDVFFDDLGIRPPDHHLGVGSGSHAELTAKVMMAFEPLAMERAYDAVVVVGDVNSTVACALVGAKMGSFVAHVEAGLRSRDWDMPEEINRVVTDQLSDLLLAPSQDAVDNLVAEGYHPRRVELVGNVMVDTLLSNLERARPRNRAREWIDGPYGLITLHRPSNVDDPRTLEVLMGALQRVSDHCPLLFPVHPRTRARLESLDVPDSIVLLEPQGYLDFLSLQADARIVLTDSGGIQEETTVLGVPCLTLRENTERPITVAEGTNQVVGTDPDRIVDAARDVLDDQSDNGRAPRRPHLWDGRAGERIATALTDAVAASDWPRPSDVVPTSPALSGNPER